MQGKLLYSTYILTPALPETCNFRQINCISVIYGYFFLMSILLYLPSQNLLHVTME